MTKPKLTLVDPDKDISYISPYLMGFLYLEDCIYRVEFHINSILDYYYLIGYKHTWAFPAYRYNLHSNLCMMLEYIEMFGTDDIPKKRINDVIRRAKKQLNIASAVMKKSIKRVK